jgi:hypothetical protein
MYTNIHISVSVILFLSVNLGVYCSLEIITCELSYGYCLRQLIKVPYCTMQWTPRTHDCSPHGRCPWKPTHLLQYFKSSGRDSNSEQKSKSVQVLHICYRLPCSSVHLEPHVSLLYPRQPLTDAIHFTLSYPISLRSILYYSIFQVISFRPKCYVLHISFISSSSISSSCT